MTGKPPDTSELLRRIEALERQAKILPSSFSAGQEDLLHGVLNDRLKSQQHESRDHLNRGLSPLKITPGTAGQFLHTKSEAGQVDAEWTDRCSSYYVSMYLASSGAPTHSTAGQWKKVADGGTPAWTVNYDIRPNGVAALADTTNKRINIPKSGVWFVTASVYFANIAAGKIIALRTTVNGTATGEYDERSVSFAHSPAIRIAVPIVIAAGSYLEMEAYQNDTNGELYVASIPANKLTAMYIGPSS